MIQIFILLLIRCSIFHFGDFSWWKSQDVHASKQKNVSNPSNFSTLKPNTWDFRIRVAPSPRLAMSTLFCEATHQNHWGTEPWMSTRGEIQRVPFVFLAVMKMVLDGFSSNLSLVIFSQIWLNISTRSWNHRPPFSATSLHQISGVSHNSGKKKQKDTSFVVPTLPSFLYLSRFPPTNFRSNHVCMSFL